LALTYDPAPAPAPDFSAFLKPEEKGGFRLDLLVTGATCAACISKIESEIARLEGVSAARLNLSTGKLVVRLQPQADPGFILETLERIGYPSTPFDPNQAQLVRDREGRRLAMALGVAAFGAGMP